MLHLLHTKKLTDDPKQTPNNDPIIHLLNNTNEKSLPNLLQNMSFQNYKLKSKLSFIVDFTFKVGNKTSIRLSNNSRRHRREKAKARFGFSKVSLKTAAIHLTGGAAIPMLKM